MHVTYHMPFTTTTCRNARCDTKTGMPYLMGIPNMKIPKENDKQGFGTTARTGDQCENHRVAGTPPQQPAPIEIPPSAPPESPSSTPEELPQPDPSPQPAAPPPQATTVYIRFVRRQQNWIIRRHHDCPHHIVSLPLIQRDT